MMTLSPEVAATLHAAEAHERGAANERVAHYRALLPQDTQTARVLDMGCGNGYGVESWRAQGLQAVGIDLSWYRFSRWIAEGPAKPLVVADAARLPFRDACFTAVVSSGMIEHIGVRESAPPYRVVALPEKAQQRAQVIRESLRVVGSQGTVYMDFPNGAFPIDFWHGTKVGSFRVHAVPDALLPTYGDVAGWVAKANGEATLLPLRGRLRFKQISTRWWGRVLSPLASIMLRLLDGLVGIVSARLLASFYPFLVVAFRAGRSGEPSSFRK